MVHKYLGKLELNDDNEYVVDLGLKSEKNISEKLYHNWKYEIPAIYSISCGTKRYTSEDVVLQKKRAIGNLYEYFADNINIEDKLFNICGKKIEFIIKTMEEDL